MACRCGCCAPTDEDKRGLEDRVDLEAEKRELERQLLEIERRLAESQPTSA